MNAPNCVGRWAAACLLIAGTSPLLRAAAYDESIQGDLSDIAASPTPWTLTAGANLLTGRAGAVYNTEINDFVQDYDLVSFTIPAGHKLDSIGVSSVAVEDAYGFVGLQEGSPWKDLLGESMTGEFLMGYALFNEDSGVDDLLGVILQNGPNPEAAPLPAGVYTFELQDFNGLFDYQLAFNVSSTATPIAGDFDGSGAVNGLDLDQWRGDFGLNGDSDADGDGDSDGADFLVWQKSLGTQSPAFAVPEPAAVLMAVLGLAALPRRVRQAR